MADQKHLTRDSRHTIERDLNDGFSFKEIGRQLGKDCTTISKEVRNHRVFEKTGCFGRHFNNCENRKTCSVSGCCNSCARPKLRLCRICPHCIFVCPIGYTDETEQERQEREDKELLYSQTPEKAKEKIRMLQRQLHYSWMFMAQEGIWEEAESFIREHMDEPAPFEDEW